MSSVDCIDCKTAIDDATAILTATGPLCDRCALRRETHEPTPLEREVMRSDARALIGAGVALVLFGLYLTTLHRYGQLVVLAGIALGAWGWWDHVAARKTEILP